MNPIKASHVLNEWLRRENYESRITDMGIITIEPIPKGRQADLRNAITKSPFVMPFTLREGNRFWQVQFSSRVPDQYDTIFRTNAGHLIAVEGIDGAGKSTICNEIKSILQEKNSCIPTIMTSPISNQATDLGSAIGRLLKNHSYYPSSITESLLFLAARRDCMEKMIVPSITDGHFVVTDRYIDSWTVYQYECHKNHRNNLKPVAEMYYLTMPADLTFVIDIPVDSPRRQNKCNDRMEDRPVEFWETARAHFLDIANKSTSHKIIDGTLTIDEIRGILETHISHYFFKRK